MFFTCATQNHPIIWRNQLIFNMRYVMAQKSDEVRVIELANEAGDDVTADLMTGYLKEQEKMVWMLVAFSTKSCTK